MINGPEDRKYIGTLPVSVAEVFKEWGCSKGTVAGRFNGELVDLNYKIEMDGFLEPISVDTEEGLEILRHSTSHLLAQAVKRLYPGTKLGIGPAIKDAFYYDLDVPQQISEDDLPKIEKEMKRIAKEKLKIERSVLSKEKALVLFKGQGEDYKLELIEDLDGEEISVYKQGEFVDLCRGPHVPDTSYIKHFKLLSLAGAYWRGDEKNKMLTRIYGTAFATKEDLDAYITRMEEAKRRDHRKLGKELDLFSIQPEGPGFPFFHPKGMVIINKLVDFWREEHEKRGYCEIRTPLILDRELWIRSGHWDHYRENMYFTEIDDRPFAIKPMNCPGGILVYKSRIRSYRDLPLRMAELGTVHRHERSGVLHGLMRVRCFTQDDAHLYVMPDQIKEEILGIMDLVKYIYKDVFGFNYRVELSTKPEKAMGDPLMWEKAEKALEEALKAAGVEYKINPGDGAFYGPKIDFHLEDCIGRTWQCGTIQLDFQMPEKFDITYVGPDGEHHRPVMLHRTVFGSLERFLGILIEHYAGAFPFWLAPVQVKVLPVRHEYNGYAKEVFDRLKNEGFRVEVDSREEKLGKKIRDAQMEKIPYMLVVGANEVQERTVAVRERQAGDVGSMSLEELIAIMTERLSPVSQV
ncbi:threonine--tRNA ligase [Thermovirga sp.]|uniref:threonine--tRNA ligase n=1 Tax=Thermovirga sp. TaxID=2699834 RepID=UPI0025DCE43E|nr:threonine--tRNA ligase [Thermovirga sp.]MBO8153576.1 threonine--tRNA ligase [Thermovirga sp.]